MAEQQHKVAAAIRQYAEKLASEKAAAGEGAPDRLTVADGQGGITTSKGTVPKDVGQSELEVRQPKDGTAVQTSSANASGGERMTVADGQGGITASKGSVPADPGQAELEVNQPTDGSVVKGATISKRAASIRAALINANPALAEKFAPASQSSAAPAVKTAGNNQAAASAPNIQLSSDTLCKIARAILSSDEGVRFAHDMLEKQAGEEAARNQIMEAIQASQVYDESEHVKQAAFNDLGNKAVAIHNSLLQAGVTEDDADSILKQASVIQEKLAGYEHPLLKAAFAQGMDDASLMAAADEAGGEEGAPPMEEALPMGGEQLGEEEIMALLEEMLASGQITEEDIKTAIGAAGGAGAEAEGGMPPEGGGAPPEEAAMAAAGA